MSLKVTDSGPPIVQSSTCLKNLQLNLQVHSVASFNNNLPKISFSLEQFRTNWRQLYININLFNNIVDCFFYRNICKQRLDII